MREDILIISEEQKLRIHHACIVIKNDESVSVRLEKCLLTLNKTNDKIIATSRKKKGKGYLKEETYLLTHDIKDGYEALEKELIKIFSKKTTYIPENSRTRAKAKYRKENYDTIAVYVPKGENKKLTQRIAKLGYKSKNAFIIDAINAKLKKEERYERKQ